MNIFQSNKLLKNSIWLFCFCAFIACSEKNTTDVKIHSDTINQMDTLKKTDVVKIPIEVFGKWFTPHAAMLNIVFKKDMTFVFNNSDDKGNDKLELGTFTFTNNEIVLYKTDKTTEKFTFQKGLDGDPNYYLQNEANYMVKSDQ